MKIIVMSLQSAQLVRSHHVVVCTSTRFSSIAYIWATSFAPFLRTRRSRSSDVGLKPDVIEREARHVWAWYMWWCLVSFTKDYTAHCFLIMPVRIWFKLVSCKYSCVWNSMVGSKDTTIMYSIRRDANEWRQIIAGYSLGFVWIHRNRRSRWRR